MLGAVMRSLQFIWVAGLRGVGGTSAWFHPFRPTYGPLRIINVAGAPGECLGYKPELLEPQILSIFLKKGIKMPYRVGVAFTVSDRTCCFVGVAGVCYS